MRKCKFAMWTEANLHLPCFVGKGYWLRFFHRLWILLTPLTIRNGGWFYCHNLKAAEDINNYPLLSSRDLKKERSRTKVTKIWNILFDCIHPATSCRRWFSSWLIRMNVKQLKEQLCFTLGSTHHMWLLAWVFQRNLGHNQPDLNTTYLHGPFSPNYIGNMMGCRTVLYTIL